MMKPNAASTFTFTFRHVIALGLSFSALVFSASHAADDKQNLQELRETVKQFLIKESTGMVSSGRGSNRDSNRDSNRISVEVGTVDERVSLASCALLEPFMPKGSRLWGKTSVGVRCLAPQQWTIYIPGTIRIWGNYYVTAKSLSQGQTVTEADISAVHGDLTSLASGIVTEPNQAVGRTSIMSLAAGIPLRQDGLRVQQIVLQGQNIHLISSGDGFKVSTEGQALNNASEGQLVKVKINSGQVLSGIAKSGGVVEVSN